MKRLLLAIAVVFLLTGCATGNNLFTKNRQTRSDAYRKAIQFCENTTVKEGIDACMDKEYLCAVEVGSITGIGTNTSREKKAASKKATRILKSSGLYKKFHSGKCSYCEVLEVYKREW